MGFQNIRGFWREQPALYSGLALVFGAACALKFTWPLLFLLPFLLISKRHVVCTLILTVFAFFYTSWIYPEPPFKQDNIRGTVFFHIEQLKVQPSPFHKSYLYKGTAVRFLAEEGVGYNLPCSIYFPFKKNRPSAHCDYKLEGTLVRKPGKRWLFKPDKKAAWEPLAHSWSFAELRYLAKEKVRLFLKKQIPHPKSASFLTALAVGDVDERVLTLEFGKMGMQHILAISGFHFALIAGFLGFFLRLFLKPKITAFVLILLLTIYFGFIGNAPSVCRAWIAISLFLIAHMAGLRLTGLNALGMGLVVEILCDPHLILHIGFQLSFLATLAILLLYPIFHRLAFYLLPRRPLSNLAMFGNLDKHVYLIGATLRKALSLNLAVHIATLPLLLFLFHRFPLLSLVYNLFFPFAVALALLLLCTSCLTSLLLPPLGSFLHLINSAFTSMLLKIIEHPPAFLDYYLRTPSFPFSALLLFFFLLFYAGIRCHQNKI